jgi:hypothetical protein
MSVQPGWGIRDMQARCRELRDVLRESPELCSEDDVLDYWPGGTQNRMRGLGSWIYCYANYVAFLWRTAENPSQSEAQQQLAREAAADALRGAPVYVTLETRDKDGVEQARGVFPKSYDALMHMSQRDLILAHLADQIQKCQAINTPSAAAALGGALVETSYQHRVLCWIVCHEPAGAPFSYSDPRPDVDTLAPWTLELTPVDIVRIIQAHRFVNGTQLQMAAWLISPPDSKQQRRPGSWETLIATAAKTLGRDARSLTRDTTLISLIAQVALAHEAERPMPGQS